MADDVVVVPVAGGGGGLTPSPLGVVTTPPPQSSKDGAAGGERPFREVFAEKLAADAARMPPGSYPEVEIRYEALSYVLQLPKTTVRVPP